MEVRVHYKYCCRVQVQVLPSLELYEYHHKPIIGVIGDLRFVDSQTALRTVLVQLACLVQYYLYCGIAE